LFLTILTHSKQKYTKTTQSLGLGLWCLTPLSTIFQLYRKIQSLKHSSQDKSKSDEIRIDKNKYGLRSHLFWIKCMSIRSQTIWSHDTAKSDLTTIIVCVHFLHVFPMKCDKWLDIRFRHTLDMNRK